MSVYDEIGGAAAVSTAVDMFYARVVADPELAPFFGSVDMDRLKGHQRAFIEAALGGAQGYRGRPVAEAHAGLGISDADFDAVVGHLAGVLAELGIPEQTIGAVATTLAPLRSDIVASPARVPYVDS